MTARKQPHQRSKPHEKKPGNVVRLRQPAQKPRIDRNYSQALKGHWEGRTRTAIERLGQIIVEATDIKASLPLYRLWIEVLSDGRERAALRKLADHLLFASESESEFAKTFLALKGLVHFELDEITAAGVLAHSLRKETRNHYALELRQLVDDRMSPRFKKPLLQTCEDELTDYFHFEALAKSFVLRNQNQAYHTLAQRIRELFPESPLVEAIELMSYVTKGDHEHAHHVAEHLVARFPGNLEYSVQLAYVTVRARNFDRAIEELDRALNLHTDPDGDVHSLLGYAMAEKALAEGDKADAQTAAEHLEKAIVIYQEMGIPISFPQENLDRLRQAFGLGAKREDTGPRRHWMIKLSERKFHELKTSPEQHVKHLRRAMGATPRPGDVCFFVGGDYRNATAPKSDHHWRLGAIYEVVSDPIWHPTQQFQSRLSLINRPEVSIPIAVHEYDRQGEAAPRRRDPKNPLHYGIYELNGTALQGIEGAIDEFASEYADLKQAFR